MTIMKAVFLDIDGPMIPVRAYQLPNQTGPVSVFDPCATAMLLKLLDISSAKIVVSSTWGGYGNYDKCANLFSKNGIDPAKYFHEDWTTPRKMSSYRIHEIDWWLKDHPEVVDYVAIDDEDLDITWVPKAVKCDGYEGFSYRNYLECCIHLNAFESEHDKRNNMLSMIEYMKKREIWRTKRLGEKNAHKTIQAAELVFPKYPDVDEQDEEIK